MLVAVELIVEINMETFGEFTYGGHYPARGYMSTLVNTLCDYH
jgi:hypothetical protein